MPYFKALAAGLLVGALYAMMRVKSPAPPPIALFGLLGMLLGQAVLAAL
ncbi:XapX domain-containing protein [Streptomyces sp. NBC_00414]